jgi:endonuclease-3
VSVHDLATATLADVEEIIRPTGFFRSKARALVEMSQDVVARHGGEVPPRMEDLVRLRGVGRKTAKVVLGVAFGMPAFIVDTHVARVARRLGLTRSRDPARIEADLCALVPPTEWTGLSLRLILHGRRVCTARDPQHQCCVSATSAPSADLGVRARGGGAGGACRRRGARDHRPDQASGPLCRSHCCRPITGCAPARTAGCPAATRSSSA